MLSWSQVCVTMTKQTIGNCCHPATLDLENDAGPEVNNRNSVNNRYPFDQSN